MADELPPGYPHEWEADVVLRDGSVAHVRPIIPADADRIRAFHAGQSEESIYLRYFAPVRELSEKDIHRFTNVDYDDRVALVATVKDRIIGIGRYDKLDDRSAEVAFNISDAYQGRGIGSVMLEHLAVIALDKGVEHFTAETLPQNRKMLNVFKEAGYEVQHSLEDGVVEVGFNIEPTEQSKAVRLAREHRAESLSIRSLLFPRSVAVVGASRRRRSVGSQILRNILNGDFTGPVYAVNNEALEVQGMRSFARVSEIPAPVDLAIIAVPAPDVIDIVRDCADADVKSVVVVSAGFAETGQRGARLQKELREAARFGGMRVLGPSSFGLINNDPEVMLNGTLAPAPPRPGRLGLFSQSHALGIAVLAGAARRHLGVSVFASAGNRVDISGNDFMQWFLDDESTHVVGLYLESMGNPRKFSRIARQLAMAKPIVAVSSGVSTYAVPPGHRIRHTSMPPEAFDAMLNQAGVIRVTNAHQFFDVVQVALHQPLPEGRRVAVVGNSDSLGALVAQIAGRWKLTVVHGPVALDAEASADDFVAALREAYENPSVDSVVACFIPPLVAPDEDVTQSVREVAAEYDKPTVATFLGMREVHEGITPEETSKERALPVFPMPEYAVRALARITEYAEWRNRDQGLPIRADGIDIEAAENLIDGWLAGATADRSLNLPERQQLLETYGLKLWPLRLVYDVEAAVLAAEELGYPIIIKSRSPWLRNQPELAGTRRHIVDVISLRQAYASLLEHAGDESKNGFIVQRMAEPGVPCVIGTSEDGLFGPVVQFSIAGPPTDLLGDIAYRIPPLTDVDVRELIIGVKAAPLLMGHRGALRADLDALGDVIGRLSMMADNHPELARVRLNPVMARPDGVDIVGAEIVLRPAVERVDSGRRTMS